MNKSERSAALTNEKYICDLKFFYEIYLLEQASAKFALSRNASLSFTSSIFL